MRFVHQIKCKVERIEDLSSLFLYLKVKMKEVKIGCRIDTKGNQSAVPYVNQFEMNMSKSKVYFFIGAFFFLFCLTLPSLAQHRSPSFSLATSGGYMFNTTFGRLVPLPGSADVPEITVALENKGASFGLSLGYLITDRIELRGSFDYSRSEIVNDVGIGLAGTPLGKSKFSEAKGFYYSGNILIYFPSDRTYPFVTVGLGAVTLSVEKLRSRTKLLIDFGTGIKFLLSRHVSASLEIKDHVSFFNYPKDFDVLFAAIYSADFKKTQHRLGIHSSLSYTF